MVIKVKHNGEWVKIPYLSTGADSSINSVYRVKGTVANYNSLPTTNVVVGDVYNLEDTGANYVATSTTPTWDKLSETVDLSAYSTTAQNDEKYQPKGNYSTSFADEEDITVDENNLLKFKDKEYSPEDYSGMGRKVLRKHYVNGVNTLTQHMINKPNTIYIIQYDYCLADQTIEIPENCVLQFEGGSFRNGEVNFNNIYISNGVNNTIFYDVNLRGVLKNNKFYSSWTNSIYEAFNICYTSNLLLVLLEDIELQINKTFNVPSITSQSRVSINILTNFDGNYNYVFENKNKNNFKLSNIDFYIDNYGTIDYRSNFSSLIYIENTKNIEVKNIEYNLNNNIDDKDNKRSPYLIKATGFSLLRLYRCYVYNSIGILYVSDEYDSSNLYISDCNGYNFETFIWNRNLKNAVIKDIFCENNITNQSWWINKNNGTRINGKDVILLEGGENYRISNISCKRGIERCIYSQASNIFSENILSENCLASKFVGSEDKIANNVTLVNSTTIINGEPPSHGVSNGVTLQIYYVNNYFADNIKVIISSNVNSNWAFGNTSVIHLAQSVSKVHLSNIQFENYSEIEFGYYAIYDNSYFNEDVKISKINLYNFGNKSKALELINSSHNIYIDELNVNYKNLDNASRYLSKKVDYEKHPKILNSNIKLSPGPTKPYEAVNIYNLEDCNIESKISYSGNYPDFIDTLFSLPTYNVKNTNIKYYNDNFCLNVYILSSDNSDILANKYNKIDVYLKEEDTVNIPIPNELGSKVIIIESENNVINTSKLIFHNENIYTLGTPDLVSEVIDTGYGRAIKIGSGLNIPKKIRVRIEHIRDINYGNRFNYSNKSEFPTSFFRDLQNGKGTLLFDDSENQFATWDGTLFTTLDGNPYGKRRGPSSDRPTNLFDAHYGVMFFDTTLKKPIWWNGSKWVDATGAQV